MGEFPSTLLARLLPLTHPNLELFCSVLSLQKKKNEYTFRLLKNWPLRVRIDLCRS